MSYYPNILHQKKNLLMARLYVLSIIHYWAQSKVQNNFVKSPEDNGIGRQEWKRLLHNFWSSLKRKKRRVIDQQTSNEQYIFSIWILLLESHSNCLTLCLIKPLKHRDLDWMITFGNSLWWNSNQIYDFLHTTRLLRHQRPQKINKGQNPKFKSLIIFSPDLDHLEFGFQKNFWPFLIF